MNDPYRLRYTNQIVGVFLLILLLFMLVLLIFFVRINDILVEKDLYFVEATQNEVEGLRKGSEVLILGQRAGEVADISYIDDSSSDIRVSLMLHPDFRKEIFESSIIAMERRFGVGAPILVIRRSDRKGVDSSMLHPKQEIKRFEAEEDRLDQLAREVESVSRSITSVEKNLNPTLDKLSVSAEQLRITLKDDTSPAMQSVKKTSDELRPETKDTLARIQSATDNLDKRITAVTIKLDTLIESDMKDTLAKITDASNSVNSAAGKVGDTSDNVDTGVADTLADMRDAAEKIEKFADEAREVVRLVKREANDLPGTSNKIKGTADDTRQLVGEIRSHWLLRRYTDQSPTTKQTSPAGVRGGGG